MTSNKQADDTSAVAAIASDVFDLRESQGSVSTFLRILRSPIRRILELTEDAAFTGHGKFFRTATYLYILATGFLASRMYADDFTKHAREKQGESPMDAIYELDSTYTSAFTAVTTYVSFLVYFAVGYMIFSRLGTAARTKRDYLKLRCLSGGFTAVLAIPMTLLSLSQTSMTGSLATNLQNSTPVAPSDFYLFVALLLLTMVFVYAYLIYVAVFEVRLQKRFWGIGTWRAIGGALVAFVIVAGSMYALQMAAVKLAGLLT